MTYAAIDWLDQVVRPDARVLEVGGGGSTVWWAARGASVVTLESSPAWAARIQENLAKFELLDRCQVILKPSAQEATDFIGQEFGPQFDVVVNDGMEPRTDLAWPLKQLLRPGGIFVWDNSERSQYEDGLRQLEESGMWRLDFYGLGPINTYAWQTSVLGSQPVLPEGFRKNRVSGLPDASPEH